jgi:hypothetical protein
MPGAQRAFLRTLRNGIRWDGQRPAIIRQMPDVQVHRFECGHYPQLEAPGERCHAVLRFREDCRPAAAGAVLASAP